MKLKKRIGCPVSKKLSAAMKGKRKFEVLRKEWLFGSSVAFLKKYQCGAGTATKYLGERAGKFPKTGARLSTKESDQVKRYALARAREVAELRKPWQEKLAEHEKMSRESAKLYEGEMYPEGAPLRAVGLDA